MVDEVWKGEKLEPKAELKAAEVVNAEGVRGPELRVPETMIAQVHGNVFAFQTIWFSRRSETEST